MAVLMGKKLGVLGGGVDGQEIGCAGWRR